MFGRLDEGGGFGFGAMDGPLLPLGTSPPEEMMALCMLVGKILLGAGGGPPFSS